MMNMNEMLGNEGEAQSADINLRQLVESKNIAETIDEQKLTQIGSDCAKGFEYDLSTRSEWENNLKDWTKLALQVREEKSWPWPKAANVKYPLLSTAAMQFNARAYPSLIPSNGDVVKVNVIGKDRDGTKLERAKRIGMFMSYQVLYEMHCWEEDMDKLLMMLPIIGTVFKKTYYNPVIKQVSKAIGPFLREEMVKTGIFPNLVKLKHGGKDKISRARSIQARVRALGVKFNKAGDWYQEFEDELCTFPRSKHDDQVDAFAYLGLMLDKLVEAPTQEEMDEDAYRDELYESGTHLTGRSSITGY